LSCWAGIHGSIRISIIVTVILDGCNVHAGVLLRKKRGVALAVSFREAPVRCWIGIGLAIPIKAGLSVGAIVRISDNANIVAEDLSCRTGWGGCLAAAGLSDKSHQGEERCKRLYFHKKLPFKKFLNARYGFARILSII
jgi:hypothetical protein